MASKMADGGAGGGSRRGGKGRKKNKKPVSLIQRLYKKLMIERGRNYFGSWFSAEEIKDFQDNPDILALDPLFQNFKTKWRLLWRILPLKKAWNLRRNYHGPGTGQGRDE